MSQGNRPPANRMMLMQFKARAVGAKKGHGLLKKKRDALKTRFQEMLRDIIECKKQIGPMMKDCAFSMAKAKWAQDSDITNSVMSRVSKPAMTVNLKADNVAGVQLPAYTMKYDEAKDGGLDSLGIGQGGQVIQACREQHREALALLIRMASLQSMFKTLDEEIKMTSRRVNALEYVIIPRIEGIVAMIKAEMDEMEREEFFRVKKVVEKKKAKMEAEKAADEARALAAGGGGQSGGKVMSASAAMVQKDADIIF